MSGVKAVSAPKKASEKQIITRFRDFPEEYSEGPGETPVVEAEKGNSTFSFNFGCETDAFCCGLYSLGEFNYRSYGTAFTQKEKTDLVREGLEKFVSAMKKKQKEITLFFTLIETPPCKLVGEALADGGLFTKVKTFTNLNSGRVNHMYVSN